MCVFADGMVIDAYTDAHVPCHYIRFKCFLRGWLPIILLLLLPLLMCSMNVCSTYPSFVCSVDAVLAVSFDVTKYCYMQIGKC